MFIKNLVQKIKNLVNRIRVSDLIIVMIGVGLAIALRWPLLSFKSDDFLASFRMWYDTIKGGGFGVFSTNFADYNPPYLYALYLVIRLFPDIPRVIATKLPSLIADFIAAGFVYQIVRLKYPNHLFPFLAGGAVLFSPTVILNSAFWGQTDSLYTSALVACLYYLLINKNLPAMIAYGVAVSFKLQAVFLLPVLLALILRREISWKSFLLVPGVMVATLVPAWLAGRPVRDLFSIYYSQATEYNQLTMRAPTVYAWLPDTGKVFSYFFPAGVIMAASVAFFFILIVARSPARITGAMLIELALVSTIMMPFFLPKMHARYFYPADVISIILAFYFPAYFFIPVLQITTSFFAYRPSLFGADQSLLPLLSLVIFAILVISTGQVIKHLYISRNEEVDGLPENPAQIQQI